MDEVELMIDREPLERKTLEEMAAAAGNGLRCKFCGRKLLNVRNTSPLVNGTVRRYRVCVACGRASRTVERVE